MALKVNEIKAIEKMEPLISIVCRQRKEQWCSDGTLLYRISEDDSIDAVPTSTLEYESARFDALMGSINPSDTVEVTGFVFNAHIESGDKSVALLLHKSNGVNSVFLVDTDLLRKVKPKKGEHFVVGVKSDKRILYNSTRSVGVCCVKDEFMAKLLADYAEMFLALDTLRQFDGEFVVN